MIYFVIKRLLGYWYYFFVIGILEKEKYVEYYMFFVNFFFGFGKVGKCELLDEFFKKVIENKEFFIIDKLGYLWNLEEIEKVKKRINSRLKERKYIVYSSNCEYFVNYFLMGMLILD